MKELMIYFSEDSDLVEAESLMKEWRGDILVSYDGLLYQLDFVTINRINREFDLAKRDSRIYCLNNTVVVECVNRDNIIRAITKLVEANMISECSTIDLEQFYSNTFPQLSSIKNWKRVY